MGLKFVMYKFMMSLQRRGFHAIISIAGAFSVVFLNSCSYDVQTPAPCFQEEVLPIFVSKCSFSGCHDPLTKKEGLDLTNYTGIMKGVKAGYPDQSEIYIKVRYGEMPPQGYTDLSQLERSIIKNWIKSGAPNNSGCISCDTNFTFNARIQPLMNKWCVGCHSTVNAGGGYDFSNYNGVVAALNANRLMGSIEHKSGFIEMPKSSGKLTECDLNAVRNWVNAGHPDN